MGIAPRWASHGPAAAALALATALGGCAHNAFQRALDRGRLDEAARLFAADSTLQRRENPLFRMAVARATPGSTIYDPAEASAELRVFLDRFPRSSHRSEALRVAALLRQLERLSDQVARLTQRADSLAAHADSATARVVQLRRGSQELQFELRRSQANLQEVQEELARLKAIDLRLSGRRGRER
jgi:hypothetical protein